MDVGSTCAKTQGQAFLPSTMIIDHVKLTSVVMYFPKKTCGYDLFTYMKAIEIKPFLGKYTSHMDDIGVCLSGGLNGLNLLMDQRS